MAMPTWLQTLLDLFFGMLNKEPVDATPADDDGKFPEEPVPVEPTEPVVPVEPVEPAPVYVPPLGVETSQPFREDIAKGQLVIDAGRVSPSGISVLTGPGWVRRAEARLINDDQHYITRLSEDGTERVVWSPAIPKSGKYEVWISYRGSENRTTAATFVVVDRAGKRRPIVVNQREPGAGGPRYRLLGIFSFEQCKAYRAPKKNYVELRNTTRGTSESVDAVLLRRVQS